MEVMRLKDEAVEADVRQAISSIPAPNKHLVTLDAVLIIRPRKAVNHSSSRLHCSRAASHGLEIL